MKISREGVTAKEKWHAQTVAYTIVVKITDVIVRNNLDIHRREKPNEISAIQQLAGHNYITQLHHTKIGGSMFLRNVGVNLHHARCQ